MEFYTIFFTQQPDNHLISYSNLQNTILLQLQDIFVEAADVTYLDENEAPNIDPWLDTIDRIYNAIVNATQPNGEGNCLFCKISLKLINFKVNQLKQNWLSQSYSKFVQNLTFVLFKLVITQFINIRFKVSFSKKVVKQAIRNFRVIADSKKYCSVI